MGTGDPGRPASARGDGRGARAAPHRPAPIGTTRPGSRPGSPTCAAGSRKPRAAPPGGWETVSAEQAAHQLAGRGADLASARSLVADYLRDTAQRVGVPVDDVAGWGLDQGDIDAIAAGAHPGRDAAGATNPPTQLRRRTRRRSPTIRRGGRGDPAGGRVPRCRPPRRSPGRDGPGRDGATADQAGAGAVAGLAREVDALRRTIEPAARVCRAGSMT